MLHHLKCVPLLNNSEETRSLKSRQTRDKVKNDVSLAGPHPPGALTELTLATVKYRSGKIKHFHKHAKLTALLEYKEF